MSYDLVRQTHPGAPAVVGARVRHTPTGRLGRVAPAVPGLGALLRVRFEGEVLPCRVDPDSLVFETAALVTLPERRP
ncbi:hypothetical protein [Methylobacterium frigidaeris]|uniref:Uncharacterized protein n=1 Tax=Methylobacterium frigidaeris TaxID=2038277 RepID=A0AA37HI61_9HYPH|nr:hypothetical protein [Methylobacterium frigidaeris]PIK72661.1 hypothetical protein CS379_12740 [Methylobacterium frigidaeris]GJD66425.1 hypothetical protein MPEAHAMD_6623 [Methylobacterium frigidaeris]